MSFDDGDNTTKSSLATDYKKKKNELRENTNFLVWLIFNVLPMLLSEDKERS